MLFWLDQRPDFYAAILVVVSLAAIAANFHQYWKSPAQRAGKFSDRSWALAIFSLLLVGRWPGFFVTREYNPDESQLLAGALTLHHDPVFWRSVDGGTAGPVDFFALLPAGWITGSDNYFSARLTALMLIGAALLFVHQTLVWVYGRSVARTATFAAACFEAFTLHPDFLHYSTELVPLTLLSGAFYLSTRLVLDYQEKPSWTRSLGLGLILGAVPFAKLQAAPMAAVLGLVLMTVGLIRLRRDSPGARANLISLVGGALTPAALLAFQLTITHQWENAVIPYFLANLAYLDDGLQSFRSTLAELAINLSRPAELYSIWLGAELILLVLILAGLARCKNRLPAPRNFLTAAVVFVVLSFLCVLAPRRPFPHYLQFTVVPVTLFFGAALGELAQTDFFAVTRRRTWLFGVLLVTSIAAPLWVRAQVSHPDIGRLRGYQAAPQEPVAIAILRYANPGESLGFWGWHSRYYVEAGMWQATRDAWSTAEIFKNKYADYYHRRYLADMMLHEPPVFVDASDTPDNPFTAEQIAHERFFPALGRFIQTHYTLVETINHIRIYARNDRAGRNAPNPAPDPATASSR